MFDPKNAPQESDFLFRLAQLPDAPRQMDVFDGLVNRPITTPPPLFHAKIYQSLVDHLLRWLALPRSVGAPEWEWRALYQFGLETNPFYYTQASIRRMLEQWPSITAEKRQIIATVLHGYLELRRKGFPNCYPSPLMPNSESAQWASIFPPEWAWRCMDVLRRVGMGTMGGPIGYRAYVRYSQGRFSPALTPASLRLWQAELWRAGEAYARPHDTDSEAPFRAAFVVAAFAGRFGAGVSSGPCQDIPECDRCPLNDCCHWYNSPIGETPAAAEILAHARRGSIDILGVDQLLQGLFDLEQDERAALSERLAAVSLRELANYTRQELQQWGGDILNPEKLRLLFELCKRFNEERLDVGVVFRTPWDIFKHFRMRMRDLRQEVLIVVLLDNRRGYLSEHVITQGTLDTSPVHPREVFNVAIRESAASILVVHNHPSGDPTPSADDIAITRKLIEAGGLVGIPVLDHIIIASDRYTSLAESGALGD